MEDLGSCELLVDDSLIADMVFKGIVIGEAGVGKSCILHRLVSDEFKDDYEVTIGAEFSSVVAKVRGRNIKLLVWDTAGQENFRSMIRVFYKGSHAAFLVFDITRAESFENLEEWVEDIRDNALPNAKILLLGNRKDEESSRQVSSEKAKALCDRLELTGYYETSAKSGEGVREVFADMARMLYLNTNMGDQEAAAVDGIDIVQGAKLNTVKKDGGRCC
eukprot:TRINITY_DN1365_c0_g2_i1.p1 TRINITY_DN1365_c0_g2~~TRINITY_DN1365_c0_g2_i1.p1  ORF type:complete len:219 (+),score=49.16 TRINITY_DN1365_c0_g2_i1:100-756(+)